MARCGTKRDLPLFRAWRWSILFRRLALQCLGIGVAEIQHQTWLTGKTTTNRGVRYQYGGLKGKIIYKWCIAIIAIINGTIIYKIIYKIWQSMMITGGNWRICQVWLPGGISKKVMPVPFVPPKPFMGQLGLDQELGNSQILCSQCTIKVLGLREFLDAPYLGQVVKKLLDPENGYLQKMASFDTFNIWGFPEIGVSPNHPF